MSWRQLKPNRIRQSRYLNNRTEQDHRTVERRVRPIIGFKSTGSARAILGRIEMIHMMHQQQATYASTPRPSLTEQVDLLAA
jgi:transposase-like protein